MQDSTQIGGETSPEDSFAREQKQIRNIYTWQQLRFLFGQKTGDDVQGFLRQQRTMNGPDEAAWVEILRQEKAEWPDLSRDKLVQALRNTGWLLERKPETPVKEGESPAPVEEDLRFLEFMDFASADVFRTGRNFLLVIPKDQTDLIWRVTTRLDAPRTGIVGKDDAHLRYDVLFTLLHSWKYGPSDCGLKARAMLSDIVGECVQKTVAALEKRVDEATYMSQSPSSNWEPCHPDWVIRFTDTSVYGPMSISREEATKIRHSNNQMLRPDDLRVGDAWVTRLTMPQILVGTSMSTLRLREKLIREQIVALLQKQKYDQLLISALGPQNQEHQTVLFTHERYITTERVQREPEKAVA